MVYFLLIYLQKGEADMQDSLYNGVFAALTQEFRLNIIANNLANVNTVGFKREKLSFKDVLYHYAHDFADPNIGIKGGVIWPEADLLTQPRINRSKIIFDQGPARQTQNPLDLYIEGQGFFKINTPNGVFYTRDGQFKLNEVGMLVNNHGYEVMGTGGPIQIPIGTKQIVINQKGEVFADGNLVGQLDVVTISDLNELVKVGNNLFKIKDGSTAQEMPAKVRILQGFLEESNMNPVEEMVQMIEVLRSFEAAQRVMVSTNEEDKNLINRVGNPT